MEEYAKNLKIIIEEKIEKNEDIKPMFTKFVKDAIKKNIKIDYDTFKRICVAFVKEEMCAVCSNPSCIVLPMEELNEKNSKEIIVAYANINNVTISEGRIKLLYYSGNNSLINSIFHEITHIHQFSKFYKGLHLHPFVYKELKEYILVQELKDYYDDNYKYISFELEANYYAIIKSIEFFEAIDFEVIQEDYERVIKNINENLKQEKRYFGGVETTVDILFEKIIYDHPEYLDKFSQLKLLYRVEDNHVYPKQKDELIDDFMLILQDPNYTIEDKEVYKRFYDHYINRTRT